MSVKRNLMRILMMFMVLFQVITCVTYGADDEGSGDTSYEVAGPGASLVVNMTADKGQYVPGEEVTFTVTIENTGEKNLKFDVEFPFDDMVSDMIDSTTDDFSFTKMVVSSTKEETTDDTKISGDVTYPNSGSLSTAVTLEDVLLSAGKKITYKMIGTVNSYAVGQIENKIIVNQNKGAAKTVEEIKPAIGSYGKVYVDDNTTDDSKIYYAQRIGTGSQKIIYRIVMDNKDANNPAKNIKLITNILDIEGTALDGVTKIKPFTSYKITYDSNAKSAKVRTGLDTSSPEVTQGEEFTEIEDFYLDFPARGRSVINIECTLADVEKNSASANNIVHWSLQHNANTYHNGKYLSYCGATARPLNPDLDVEKSVSPNENLGLTYTIKVSNKEGAGYAKDIQIWDEIKGLQLIGSPSKTAFSDFVLGNPSKTGTENVTNYGTKNSTYTTGLKYTGIDIEPGGSVTYTITTTFADGITSSTKGSITNVAQVKASDGLKVIGLDSLTSSPGGAGSDLVVKKSVSQDPIEIGKSFTYTIEITNDGDADQGEFILEDITSSLFNNGNKRENVGNASGEVKLDLNVTSDGEEALKSVYADPIKTFKINKVYLEDEEVAAATVLKTINLDTDILSTRDADTDSYLREIVMKELKVNETIKLEIEVEANPMLLNNQSIINTAIVKTGAKEDSDTTLSALIHSGYTSRDFYNEKDVRISQYVPGQKIKYKITVTGANNTTFNNEEIKDKFLAKILNKDEPEFIFKDGYTWEYKVSDGRGSNGKNMIPNGIVDVPANKTLNIIIEGYLRDDLAGTITNGYTDSKKRELNPVASNLTLTKTYMGENESEITKYIPGEDLWMKIRIENKDKGDIKAVNAYEIILKDLIGDINTTKGDGTSIPAFVADSIIVEKINEDGKSIPVDSETGEVINNNLEGLIDIPANSYVEYIIKGTVSPEARGEISNITSISRSIDPGINIATASSSITSSTLGKLTLEKAITEYLDPDEEKATDQSGYVPGGYVKYEIILKNEGESGVTVKLTDELLGIETKTLAEDRVTIEDGFVFNEGSYIIYNEDLDGENSTTLKAETAITGTEKIEEEDLAIGGNKRLRFVITGKINDDVLAEFRNTAKVSITDDDGAEKEIEVKSPNSYPLPPDITITKEVASANDTKVTTYNSGEEITYIVTVENATEKYGLGLRVRDLLSDVTVETAEGTTLAFNMTTVTITEPELTGGATVVTKGPRSGGNLDDEVNMPPNSTLKYEIKVRVVESALESIDNIATVSKDNEELARDNVVLEKFVDKAVIDADMYISKSGEGDSEVLVTEGPYVPGEEVTYYLRIKNTGETSAEGIEVIHKINGILGKYDGGGGVDTEVFVEGTIKVDDSSLVEIDVTDLAIEAGEEKIYKITAQVKGNIMGPFKPSASVDYKKDDEEKDFDEEDLFVTFMPGVPELILTKDSDKKEYGNSDTEVVYTLTIKNTGTAIATNVRLIDNVTNLKASLKTGGVTEIFSDWSYTVDENKGGTVTRLTSKGKVDIDEEVSLYPNEQNVITITLTGKLNEGIDDEEITNVFLASGKYIGSNGEEEDIDDDAENTIKVEKDFVNAGMLDIRKRAMKDSVKVGEPVEYEIVIENNTESSIFVDTYLKDIIPAGFRYVKGSSEHIFTKADGTEEVYTDNPTQTNSLKYQLPDMGPGDKYTIRYILTPSIGVTFGKYTNQAGVKFDDDSDASDTVSASVSIEADALFDTASIIGKVFFDHNQNGHQDEEYKEAGIPGVRLISPRGITAVTDRFGRYHLPDMWVYNKLGQVAEVKLDITTLPANTKVISENPKIKRVSSAALTKFNFSVVVEDDKFAVDTTRIYLEKGAIWMVNDFVEIDQELSLNFPERIVVKDNKLTEAIDFNIDTNYGEFIDKYELAIYPQNDRGLKQPIKVFSGRELVDGTTITWEDVNINKDLVAGRELKVRLRVWDKNGRMDKTEIGHIDMVRRIPILDLFNYETQNTVELLVKNINLNTSIVRIVGDGLEGVNTVTIKDDEYSVDDNEFLGIRYIPSGKNILPVKVKYDDGREEEYELITNYKDTYYIGTAIIDLNFGKYHIDGNEEILQVDNPYGANYYEDKIYREGRLAIFGKGRYKDKLRFTTYIDTKTRDIKAMFDHVFDKDDQTVFERVQDTDTYYYPTYGDKSYVYRHVDTDGDIYFKAEYEDSYLMWGNYETEIDKSKYINYNRSLYGAKLDYVSTNKTDYGDEDRLIAFMSKPYSLFGHDEFLGTGGSLYFLKNNDVLSGSEKVYIKVVNSLTDRTETTIDLVEGRDYEFDPYQGRVILDKPLKTNAANIDDEIIQSGASGDYYNYLVVDYEYIPSSDEGLSEKDYGVTFEKFLGKHLGLGGTYVKENRDGTDYRLKGAELTIKFTENSYIKGGVSESEGTQSNNSFVSLDGGLTFDKVGIDNPGEITGQAYEAMAVINLADIAPNLFGSFGNELTTWYEQKDAGYSFASDLEDTYIESYGSRLTLRHSDRIKSSLKYEEYEERDGINKIKGKVIDKYKAVTAEVEYLLTDKLSTSFAYKYIKEMIDVDGNDEMLAANIIGMRLEYEANDDLTLYLEGQGTVSRDDGYEVNNRVTVGFDADVTENLSVNASTSVGNRGNYSELGLDYDLTDNYSIYIGATSDGEENQDDITFGQRMKVSDKVEIYQESQILREDGRTGRADNYGIDYDYNDDLTIGGSFQYGKIELPDDKGEARRKAFSLYAEYDTFNFDWKTKLEYREDKEDGSSEKIKQYLTTNYFDYIHNEEITFGGKFNYAYTDDETETESNKFIEGSIGVAYRPIENDDLNFLARYTFILNDDPNDSESLKAHIAEFEAICDATERLDLGLKLAYRDEEETFIRESGNEFTSENELYLIGLRANYIIMNDWDIYLEYHWLINGDTHDVRDGAVVGIYKNVHTNLKIGGGYNFSGFSSDLSQEDYEAHGWFINIVGRF